MLALVEAVKPTGAVPFCLQNNAAFTRSHSPISVDTEGVLTITLIGADKWWRASVHAAFPHISL